jgi:hypothetical protein
MTRLAMSLGVCTLVGLGTASIAHADTRPINFVASQAPNERNIKDLIGAGVINESGQLIGTINYLLMNDKGLITTVTIGVGGLLGVGEKNVGITFSDLSILNDERGSPVIRLSVSKQQLEAAPKFQWRETPMVVRVEETIKKAADKVQATASDLGKKTGEIFKEQTKPATPN